MTLKQGARFASQPVSTRVQCSRDLSANDRREAIGMGATKERGERANSRALGSLLGHEAIDTNRQEREPPEMVSLDLRQNRGLELRDERHDKYRA